MIPTDSNGASIRPAAGPQPAQNRFWRASLARQGLTLIELILVIAIIIVVAALAAPAVQRIVKSQGIRNGADRVRVAMGSARVQAIRSGEVHALFYFRNGTWFDVAPLSDYQRIASARGNREGQQQSGFTSDLEEDLLPVGVRFVAGQTSSDSRSVASQEDASGSNGMEMILFYPDGTSQDASLTVQNELGDEWTIELRGLTGSATALRSDPNSRR